MRIDCSYSALCASVMEEGPELERADLIVMMMSTFIAHDSVNVNAQCTEGGGGGGGGKS